MMWRSPYGSAVVLELVADTFSSEPAPRRAVSVRSGRRVAIQVPYGLVDDCEVVSAVDAEFEFTVATDDDLSPRRAGIDLQGTDILDTVRAEQCATRLFETVTRTRFDNTAIVDGEVTTELVIEATGSDADLVIEGASGTVLVGVRLTDERTGVHIGDEPIVIPLTFVVNRCDPHALAEVTKRFGLDLALAIEGAEPVSVGLDVSELTGQFETAIEECTSALDAD